MVRGCLGAAGPRSRGDNKSRRQFDLFSPRKVCCATLIPPNEAGVKILFILTYYRPHLSGLTIYVERLASALANRAIGSPS